MTAKSLTYARWSKNAKWINICFLMNIFAKIDYHLKILIEYYGIHGASGGMNNWKLDIYNILWYSSDLYVKRASHYLLLCRWLREGSSAPSLHCHRHSQPELHTAPWSQAGSIRSLNWSSWMRWKRCQSPLLSWGWSLRQGPRARWSASGTGSKCHWCSHLHKWILFCHSLNI